MTLRVTPQLFVAQALRSARERTANLARLQQQAGSGLKLQKPSDAPADMRILLARRITDTRIEVNLSNIQDASTALNLSVSQLKEANNVLVKAKQLALEGNQSLPEDREALASEVDALLGRLVDIANAQQEERSIFAGTAVDRQPFVTTTDGTGTIMQVDYRGSLQPAVVPIGDAMPVDVFYSGSDVFQDTLRGETIFLGETGAAPGTGTDSGVGQGTLVVRHTATTYAPGSGVQPGASSPAEDTIIGPAGSHTLTVDDTSGTGSSGTISLNGGEPVAFTSADSDLLVTGPDGEQVFVDTSAVTPGFNGTVDITADGMLSTDSGTTEIPIDFTANQIVTDSANGEVTHVDSTLIRRAGTESLEYTGTADAFGALIELREDLRNARGLSDSEFHDAMSRHIADLDRVRDSVMETVGRQSADLESLDALKRRSEDVQLETRQAISDLESADLSEVVINLQSEQNLLQLVLASSVRMFDQNLLDFLG